MQDETITKQENVVHNLFLRSLYDKTNTKKFTEYQTAKSLLTDMKLGIAK